MRNRDSPVSVVSLHYHNIIIKKSQSLSGVFFAKYPHRMGGISYCHRGNSCEKREEKQKKNVKEKGRKGKWEVKG
jgi:hypothetical protein